MKFKIQNKQLFVRRLGLIAYDILAVTAATYLGLIARFDFSYAKISDKAFIETAWSYLPYSIAFTLLIFWAMHL